MKIKHLLVGLLLPIALCALAAPFTVSADGQEVTDTKTGLIWRRCVEGMTASGGTCTGTASTFTHEAALTSASTRAAATGVAWRLPNVKELFNIADKSRRNPAIDAAAFPGTPVNRCFWSSSPFVEPSNTVFCVDFLDGSMNDYSDTYRYIPNYVRLVRAGQ